MSKPRRAREQAVEISDVAWALLNDEPTPESVEKFILECFDRGDIGLHTESLQELWQVAEPEIVGLWAETHPGQRPCAWWRWSCPIREAWMPPASNRSVDPRPDPKFESQASFLRRHRLLLEGELERLTAADFERAEAVSCD